MSDSGIRGGKDADGAPWPRSDDGEIVPAPGQQPFRLTDEHGRFAGVVWSRTAEGALALARAASSVPVAASLKGWTPMERALVEQSPRPYFS